MTAALDIRGLKRICMSCGTRFYDMNRRPITCPSCDTEFTGEIKVKTRRSRSSAALADAAEKPGEAATEEIEASEDTISLNEIDEGGDADEEDADLDLGEDLENIDDLDEDVDEDDEDLEIGVVEEDD